ncbi:MAG: ABC transporter ATP-binding protein [Anaerolineaceae bacterium]|nr:ABC transporter ATP-binding protein [Anaerolineaceae bacterium]
MLSTLAADSLKIPIGVTEPILRVISLTKRFPRVLAVDCVSFDVRPGEIHCLLGENGAGKTTLSECIYGYLTADSGSIYYQGKRLENPSPKNSIRLGIGMVHQHFVLIEELTVIENVVLGVEGPGFRLGLSQAEAKLAALCKQYGVELDLHAKIWQLPVGQQQWVEILKTLYVGSNLLIFDEPTAVLTPQESEKLFSVLQKMKAGGLSIILITHKLREVMAVSDRVTILRKGKYICTMATKDVSMVELARLMVGRDVALTVDKESVAPGSPVIEIENLTAVNDFGRKVLHNISFQLRANEILGIAGVSGNGQKELSEVLIGVRKPESGKMQVNGKVITRPSVQTLMANGVRHIPQDRIAEGIIADFSIAINLILGFQDQKAFRTGIFMKTAAILEYAKKCIREFDIATPSPNQITRTLSGGNLQKVILARELSQNPLCLIANQPTRGLDVGAIEFVHQLLFKQRQQGAAVLLISEDLDEIFTLSDRIAVMFKGQILGIFDAREANIDRISLLMAGIND